MGCGRRRTRLLTRLLTRRRELVPEQLVRGEVGQVGDGSAVAAVAGGRHQSMRGEPTFKKNLRGDQGNGTMWHLRDVSRHHERVREV